MAPDVFARMHKVLTGSVVYAMVTARDGALIDEYYQGATAKTAAWT